MKILYVAKHDSGGNDDEGAIYRALLDLGHTVYRLRESKGRNAHKMSEGDLLLFHKWSDFNMVKHFAGKCLRAFWYFDRIESGDVTLASRDRKRIEWMERMIPNVEIGFCTDGDWVEKWGGRKLVWLAQGADQRIVGRGTCEHEPTWQILFVGNTNAGVRRTDFHLEMRATYGDRYYNVSKGCHGEPLKNLIAAAKIVVAPDFPCSDRYWSNRVYNMLGFGAFLLHPYCKGLADQYDGAPSNPSQLSSSSQGEIVFYHRRTHIHALIEEYLHCAADRDQVAGAGLSKTIAQHTYRHRCEQLIKVVEEHNG